MTNNKLPINQNIYQQIIGTLMYYIICTYPNLAFCISYLSQFPSRLLDIYYTTLKRDFYYISNTHSYILIYPHFGSVKLEGFQMLLLLIVLIVVISIPVMSFNSKSLQSLDTSRNKNISSTLLLK